MIYKEFVPSVLGSHVINVSKNVSSVITYFAHDVLNQVDLSYPAVLHIYEHMIKK